jgi:hypothetical protein
VEPKYFYPVHYRDAHLLLNASDVDKVDDKIKDSYLIHLWDSMMMSKYNLDKNNFPPGSFLDRLSK